MELCSTDDQGRPDDERTGVPETRQRMKFTTAVLPLASVPRPIWQCHIFQPVLLFGRRDDVETLDRRLESKPPQTLQPFPARSV